MKFSNKYNLRELSGRSVLMPASVSDPSVRTASGALRAITLSDSASWLLKTFEGQDFSVEQAVDAVCGHFDVPRNQVERDMTALLDTLRSCGPLED